ncbi:MAG: septal ring lytic transglycosylase RlpA family protein [Candidatus Acidiferrales bacterium]
MKNIWRTCPERVGSLLLLIAAMLLPAILVGCAKRRPASHPPAQAPASSSAPQPQTKLGPPGSSPRSGPPPATERRPVVPGEYVEEGVASWYGVPFNGRRTSNGEIYDMHEFTAAHRTLPFNAVVRVTNLRNGKQTQVRINDRGPFVADRVIDLSLSAAEAIEMVGPGTAQVRLEVIAGPSSMTGFFAVQIGAFREQENAQRLKVEMESRNLPVSIVTYDSPSGLFYRVRVGRVPTEADANQLAGQLRATGQLTTFVVRLDE